MVVLVAWVVSPAVRSNHRGLSGCHMGTQLVAEGLLRGKLGKFPELGRRMDMKVESSWGWFVLSQTDRVRIFCHICTAAYSMSEIRFQISPWWRHSLPADSSWHWLTYGGLAVGSQCWYQGCWEHWCHWHVSGLQCQPSIGQSLNEHFFQQSLKLRPTSECDSVSGLTLRYIRLGFLGEHGTNFPSDHSIWGMGGMFSESG